MFTHHTVQPSDGSSWRGCPIRSSHVRLDSAASQPQHVHWPWTLPGHVLHPIAAQLLHLRRKGTNGPRPRRKTTSRNFRWFFSFLRPCKTIELLLNAPWTVAGHGWCCTMKGVLTSVTLSLCRSLSCDTHNPKMLSPTGQHPKLDLRGPPGRLSAVCTRSVRCKLSR